MEAEKPKETVFWDVAALEAEKDTSTIRADRWRKAARNWLAHYVEHKARHFIVQTVENKVKLGNGAQILDVGCGPGKWVNLFAGKGFATTGIDSSPWMIRLAKKKVRNDIRKLVKFYVMSAAKLNLPSNSYDMVNCVTVLQHIFNDEDWKRAVHEMVRVTKPSGYVIVFEAAPSFILRRRTPNLRFRTMKEYINEFDKAGAQLTYWRATDLSFPVTFLGLRRYAASFSKRVYYYFAGEVRLFSPHFLSLLSRIAVILAEPIDYKLAETPLSFLSVGKILLFRKIRA
jgi:ubiquinone/menaquinone biosynthesis C-methylase UbiE